MVEVYRNQVSHLTDFKASNLDIVLDLWDNTLKLV